jgi:hypothetical protein
MSMPFRLRAFAFHLVASACLLSLVLGTLYAGWYWWPGWYLMGAETIVGLMVLVDVGVGPLATLVVANPAKPRHELARDIALIVVVQLAALGYGAQTLWSGRLLYYAFSLDRAEVVTAADFDDQVIALARKQNARIIPEWYSRTQWIWAPLPDDPETRDGIITAAITGGHDVTSRPEYFRPLSEGAAAMRDQYVPVQSLAGPKGLAEGDYRARLAELGRPESGLGALAILGRTRDGAMIFDRATGEPLAFWPIKVDLAAAKKDKSK